MIESESVGRSIDRSIDRSLRCIAGDGVGLS